MPRPRHRDAQVDIHWRIHLREQTVLARHLQVVWYPSTQNLGWDLRVYLDGAGQAQAWALWAPTHGRAQDSFVWHGRVQPGRRTLKPST